MAMVQIKLQLGGEEFWWQNGFTSLCDKNVQDIRQLLHLSRQVTSSIEWQLLAPEKEHHALSNCCRLLSEGVTKINHSAADFIIPQGSEKEAFFRSLFHDLRNSDSYQNQWCDQLYINSLRLIWKYTTLAHVFLLVHTISKKNFKRLGAKGIPKLVQWICSNKDELQCPILTQQVDQITNAAAIIRQNSTASDLEDQGTKDPSNPSVAHLTSHNNLHEDESASESTETRVAEHGDIQTDINLPYLQTATVSSLPENGQTDLAIVEDSFSFAPDSPSKGGSLSSAAFSVEEGTIGKFDVQFATNKRKRVHSNNLQSTTFETLQSSHSGPFQPNLMPHSNSLQTNMQELSSESMELLCILDALGGDRIPKQLFEACSTPQPRWNDEGDIVRAEFSSHTCESSHLKLVNTGSLNICLQELIVGCWVHENDNGNLPSTNVSLSNKAHHWFRYQSNREHHLWFTFSLQLSCHAFPRDPVLDANFYKNGTQLAHIIDHLCLKMERYDPPDSLKLELAEVLVARARLGRSKCPDEALEKALALLGGAVPDYIQALIVLRRSISLRLKASYKESEKLIREYQHKARRQATANPRLHALNRLIMISHVENLIQLEDYETGRKEIHYLNDSEPSNNVPYSLLDLSVNFKKWSTVSKIYQSQGCFDESKDYLSNIYPLLKSAEFRADPNRFQIICRLSDLLCADGSLSDAKSKIEHEFYLMGVHGKLLGASRRLEVSMLDVKIAEGRLNEASALAQSLKGQFSRLSSPDISDQWLHVRSVIASARLLYCQESYTQAVAQWESLFSLIRKYHASFEPEGFYFGLGQMSMSAALLQLGPQSDDRTALELRETHAKKAFDLGCAILAREPLNFWIPLLPKSYIPRLLNEIKCCRPSWAETGDFHSLHQKYSTFLDSLKKKSGFSSRM